MKKYQSAAIVLGIALAAFGCNKEERVLFSKDGQWKTTKQTQQFYFAGTLVNTDTEITMTEVAFKKDGTGTIVEDGETNATTWSLNEEGDVLDLCVVDGSISTCTEITLLESSKDVQKWHSEFVDDDARLVYDYELARK
jgi:hypothetical protein